MYIINCTQYQMHIIVVELSVTRGSKMDIVRSSLQSVKHHLLPKKLVQVQNINVRKSSAVVPASWLESLIYGIYTLMPLFHSIVHTVIASALFSFGDCFSTANSISSARLGSGIVTFH